MPFILTSVITINDLIHHHGEYLTKVKTVLSNQSRRQQVSEAIMLLIALENCKKYYMSGSLNLKYLRQYLMNLIILDTIA